ncbi:MULTISPECIES: hypothetical protein [unclassified Bradyrhizobium]|nr:MULTISPECIES: hypothetical protein [unclassified Bradyrhizobium]
MSAKRGAGDMGAIAAPVSTDVARRARSIGLRYWHFACDQDRLIMFNS